MQTKQNKEFIHCFLQLRERQVLVSSPT